MNDNHILIPKTTGNSLDIKRCEESFKSQLVGFDFDTIEKSPHVIFGLSTELNLIYFNRAWFQFAELNNGEPEISQKFSLGVSIESAISGNLKGFYIEHYKNVIEKQKVWKHEFECSSPEIYRLFYHEAYPLKNKAGIIVVNSLKVEKVIDTDFREISTHPLNEYIDSNGIITQCSNCRKTHRVAVEDTWDWVPALVKKMPENVSHSICPVCYDYYWKNAGSNK